MIGLLADQYCNWQIQLPMIILIRASQLLDTRFTNELILDFSLRSQRIEFIWRGMLWDIIFFFFN